MAESEDERLDRELIELLTELRVALPGVQVLFGFLLTVPFTSRFAALSDDVRRPYFLAVLLTAIAIAFLIAPSAHHRMRFRERAKESLLRVGNICTVVGLALLAAAVGLSVYVVTTLVYDSDIARIVAGLLTGTTAILWFVVPRFFPRA